MIENKMKFKKKIAVYLSIILSVSAIFPVYAVENTDEVVSEEYAGADTACDDLETVDISEVTFEAASVNRKYDVEIHLGECRYLKVKGDENGSGYTWKVSDDKVVSVNPDGRCKGLSCNATNGYSETIVTAEKNGVKHEMWVKVTPSMCTDMSTVGVPGAKWNVAGIFKDATGKVRYKSTNRKVIKVNKKGVARGKKAGTADVIKQVKTDGGWTEVDRETFTVVKPSIRTELLFSRLKYPTLSANTVIINSDVTPSGFKSSKPSVISVEGDMLKLNSQGAATIYTLYGTVGKTLKRYQTRITVIGRK